MYIYVNSSHFSSPSQHQPPTHNRYSSLSSTRLCHFPVAANNSLFLDFPQLYSLHTQTHRRRWWWWGWWKIMMRRKIAKENANKKKHGRKAKEKRKMIENLGWCEEKRPMKMIPFSIFLLLSFFVFLNHNHHQWGKCLCKCICKCKFKENFSILLAMFYAWF